MKMSKDKFNSLINRIKSNDQELTNINLWCDNIGDEGAEKIAEALKVNKTIISIYLGFSNIGDKGAEKIAEALKNNNKTIIYIDLHGNNISAKILIEIDVYLDRNRKLAKSNNGVNQNENA